MQNRVSLFQNLSCWTTGSGIAFLVVSRFWTVGLYPDFERVRNPVVLSTCFHIIMTLLTTLGIYKIPWRHSVILAAVCFTIYDIHIFFYSPMLRDHLASHMNKKQPREKILMILIICLFLWYVWQKIFRKVSLQENTVKTVMKFTQVNVKLEPSNIQVFGTDLSFHVGNTFSIRTIKKQQYLDSDITKVP